MDIINEESNTSQEGDKKRPRSELEPQKQQQQQQDMIKSTCNMSTNSNDQDQDTLESGQQQQQQKQQQSLPPSSRRRTLNQNNIRQMKLEAIFHPKFENENQNDPQIRQSMLEKVSKGEGVLEVSLKHSGSLLLWSGGKRFYSKNSTDNQFSRVGEVLLRQHFARAWAPMTQMESFDHGTDSIEKEAKFKECSDFVEHSRLTLSFEVVTSILGHHGDLPKRDFLILIAVADRSTGTFYSTTETMQFAQRFRLPHNDAWIFQSKQSASRLFHLYDTSRETGLAEDVIETLSQAADGGHVKSLYPHTIFQGNILEGIVIRFVRIKNNEQQQPSFSQLCLQSDHILKDVPPERILTIPLSHNSGPMKLLRTNLRDLFGQNDTDTSDSMLKDLISESIAEDEATRTISKLDKREINLPSVATKLLQDTSIDLETQKICLLIQNLEKLKLSVNYHIILEQNESPDGNATSQRYLCIIHITRDSCHKKYHHATRASGSMPLFRGFSVELISQEMVKQESFVSSALNSKLNKVRLQSIGENIDDADDGKLILKMKFLPYMVRTFICRNGLSILRNKGTGAFNQYAYDQLIKWGISNASVEKWMGFFSAWGVYCESPSKTNSEGALLPTLMGGNYLHHFYHFQSLYSSGFFKTMTQKTTIFHGLVVVVGMNKDEMKDFAVSLSSILGCARTSTDINALTEMDVARALKGEGGGLVCAATIVEGVKNLRTLGMRYKENIFIVRVGCSKEEIEAAFVESGNPDTKELKRTIGMAKAWEKSKSALSVDVPIASISSGPSFDADNNLKSMVKKLKDASKSVPDNRPGILVFFPNIPGCGKSTLCEGLTADCLSIENDRTLIVNEGDKTVEKFWPLALKQKAKHPSSIFVADKNTPPASWKSVDNICSKTQSIAVCVLPDSPALEDTVVNVSSKDKDETETISQFNFPFSLSLLALCMSRILERQPNTHNGKLDVATEDACMVVVKFYCFYRNFSVSSLLRQMAKLGRANNKLIRIPFFNEGSLPDMPKGLKEILETAISVQTRQDLKMKAPKDNYLSVERDLRKALFIHQDYIKSLPVAESCSRDSFKDQLKTAISTLTDTFEERNEKEFLEFRPIRIVSLDFNRQDVNSILHNVSKTHDEFNAFLQKRKFEEIQNTTTDDDNKNQDRFINKTHCTFAHAQRNSQNEMRTKFDHIIGVSCTVTVNAILFDDTIAALEISIPSTVNVSGRTTTTTVIPVSVNDFTHITIWCKKSIKPFESNNLPTKVNHGLAKRVEVESPVPINGKFSYWYSD